MKFGPAALPFRLLGLATLLFIGVLVVFLARREPSTTLPPVTILPQPFVIPVTARDRFAHTFSSGRISSRVENALFGRRKSININGDVFVLSSDRLTNLDNAVRLGKPTFANSTGLRIWFLDGADVSKVSEKILRVPEINFMSHPRISTAEGIGCSLFFGQSVVLNGITNSVGFSMECVGQVEKHLMDLVTTILNSELVTKTMQSADGIGATNGVEILTNINIRARLEIPKGNGVLFIQIPPEGSNGKVFGYFINPA